MLNDFRYALKMLLKNPGFTAVAVITLALGIGANTAIFSLANAIILKTIAVSDPENLVIIDRVVSYPFFRKMKQRNNVFRGLAGRFPIALNLTARDSSERLRGELVSGSYFSVLGVEAVVGRVLTEEDDGVEQAHPVCVISYNLWQSRFGGDPNVLSQRILLNARPFQIVGVMKRGFQGASLQERFDVLVPTSMTSLFLSDKRDFDGWFWLQMIGRLGPEVAWPQAEANILALARQINRESGRENMQFALHLRRGDQGFDTYRSRFERPIFVLSALVGSLLLIACANLSNLLLSRAIQRRREIAIRLALGASRARLIRQLLFESVLLSMIGGFAGLLLSLWMVKASLYFVADNYSTIEANLDTAVLLFATLLSVLTGLIFGLTPAWQSTRTALVPALKEELGSAKGWGTRAFMRRFLLVAQISLSLVIVFAAGLFARTLRNLRTADLGFRPERIVLLTLDPSRSGYKVPDVSLLYDQLLEQVRRLPAVDSASLGLVPILSGQSFSGDVQVPGYQPKNGAEPTCYVNFIGADYFKTLGISILAGRDFKEGDRKGAQPVVVINQRFASYYWPGQNPIGKRFGWGGGEQVEIVGLVKNTKYQAVREEAQFIYYLPLRQHPFNELTVHIRTRGEASKLISAVRNLVHSLDPKLPVYNIQTLETQIDSGLSQERTLAVLSSFFGALAMLLAMIGLYGVVAYSVKYRSKEIGIRIALGARGNEVVLLFLKENLVTVVLGLVIGIACTFPLGKYCASLVYGLLHNDTPTLLLATLLLLIVGLLTTFMAARKATRVDPMVALRYE